MIIKKAAGIFIFFVLISLSIETAFGQTSPTPTPETPKTSELENQIKEYQAKVTELQGQTKTLSSQIGVMDSQIRLTELRIKDAEEKINELDKGIEIAKGKVSDLENNIGRSTKALIGRITATYQAGAIKPWEVFLTANNISDVFNRLKYLRVVQIYDKKKVYAAEQAKNDYANQKSIYEDKQTEAQTLRDKLGDYTTQLDSQKKEKENLFATTKNSENEYQRRLADALRELSQIQKAAKVLVSTEPRHVARGEAIGLMGNTGYSFGAHLHFGIYNISSLSQYNYYSNYENPSNYLEAKNVNWDTGCGGDPSGQTNTGSGSFAWPMTTDGLYIEQGVGTTCYSNIYYGGKPHPAFDMLNKSDIVVRSVDEGQAYICRNCTGDGANGVFVFHSNGKMSLYWHLQ